MESKGVYHERQRLQFCLLHALNNLLQEKESFSRAELDAIAGKLVHDDPDKSRWTPLSVHALRDVDGCTVISLPDSERFLSAILQKKEVLSAWRAIFQRNTRGNEHFPLRMVSRKPVLVLLCLTVLAPIVLYTGEERFQGRSLKSECQERALETKRCPSGEVSGALKEPIWIIYSDNSGSSDQISAQSNVGLVEAGSREFPFRNSPEHKSRVLSATEEGIASKEGLIKSVTDKENHSEELQKSQLVDGKKESVAHKTKNKTLILKEQVKKNERPNVMPAKANPQNHIASADKKNVKSTISDARVRQLKDQLIRARVYQGLASTRSNPHFIRELRARIREVQRALGDATKDSELSKKFKMIVLLL